MNRTDKQIRSYAELIVLSGPALFAYIYNRQGEALVKWIMRYITNEESTFHTSYIMEDINNDAVRGMILVLPVTVMKQKSKNEVKLIRQNIHGFGSFVAYMIQMMWRMRIMIHYPKLEEDEVFVSNLAVYDEYQGMGIGSKLLREAEKDAKTKGYSKMSLFVELDNDKAIGLYKKQGYETVSKKVFPKMYNKYHLHGFYKMVKRLS